MLVRHLLIPPDFAFLEPPYYYAIALFANSMIVYCFKSTGNFFFTHGTFLDSTFESILFIVEVGIDEKETSFFCVFGVPSLLILPLAKWES